ncbi:unnamed protein product [Alternaria alternata]
MQQEKHAQNSPWRHRRFPPDTSSELPWDDQFRQPVLSHDRWKSRVDFNAFINSMDDESFGYLCLIREYATRALQGKAAEYSGLYKAFVSQTAREEDTSRITEESSTISDNIIGLPSVVQTSTENGLDYESDDEQLHKPHKRRSFTLRYPIVMPRVSAKQDPDPIKCPPWLKPNDRLRDQSANPRFIVERSLEKPTSYDPWDTRGEISELEGQVTYWYREIAEKGWEGLLLVDPCLKDPSHLAVIEGSPYTNISRIIRYPELEDEEKADIALNPLQWHPSAAFTKYVLHDDVMIHFSVANAGPGGNPLSVTPFIRGFVISKWTAQLNHIRRSYSHTRAALFSKVPSCHRVGTGISVRHTVLWGADWKEWMFETMTRFTTDLYLYRLEVETNMRALGIDVDDPQSYGFVGKREAQMWRFLRSTCLDLQDMFQQLTNSYTQVIALREAQASNAQASSIRWLTVLGTLFVPISIVAGIMSMGGEFLPGEKKFWVFFAVVCPVLLVIGAVLVVTLGRRAVSNWLCAHGFMT